MQAASAHWTRRRLPRGSFQTCQAKSVATRRRQYGEDGLLFADVIAAAAFEIRDGAVLIFGKWHQANRACVRGIIIRSIQGVTDGIGVGGGAVIILRLIGGRDLTRCHVWR